MQVLLAGNAEASLMAGNTEASVPAACTSNDASVSIRRYDHDGAGVSANDADACSHC
jgi:hypothetical protein